MNYSWLILFLAIRFPLNAQPAPELYTQLTQQAHHQYKARQYLQAARLFSQAIKANANRGHLEDRYTAAQAWALSGERDSAFYQLNRITASGTYTDVDQLKADTAFITLRPDSRWFPLVNQVKRNKAKQEARYNKPLIQQLDSIYQTDQAGRIKIDPLIKTQGPDSPEVQELWKSIIQTDSVNTDKVIRILDQYGWLGQDVIGLQGNLTLFLVIQHANLAIKEKYLPMLKDAVKKGNAFSEYLALLTDRIKIAHDRPQVYGSQLQLEDGRYVPSPIIDEANVNKRRAEVNLEPLEAYIARMNADKK